ncbi:uncharacterized protein LOC135931942 isoform X1 [Gordionus sp. m RMFG-2023]|uniref:uncharacterized protein LOC135931942 isoform X1 n=1 Tax=Gordionus sp. m RMFG-2023 TaxID=3053472 RepID=UPI0031FBB4F9
MKHSKFINLMPDIYCFGNSKYPETSLLKNKSNSKPKWSKLLRAKKIFEKILFNDYDITTNFGNKDQILASLMNELLLDHLKCPDPVFEKELSEEYNFTAKEISSKSAIFVQPFINDYIIPDEGAKNVGKIVNNYMPFYRCRDWMSLLISRFNLVWDGNNLPPYSFILSDVGCEKNSDSDFGKLGRVYGTRCRTVILVDKNGNVDIREASLKPEYLRRFGQVKIDWQTGINSEQEFDGEQYSYNEADWVVTNVSFKIGE